MAQGRIWDEASEREWLEGWKAGPTRTRWTALPPQPGDPAPDLALPDETGRPRRLSEFWDGRPALLLFWRQFGCGCGLDRAKRLLAEWPTYEAIGAGVVVIGQGEPARAAAYRERYAIPCPILCDPDRAAYQAYGLPEGRRSQLLFDADPQMQRCTMESGRAFAEKRKAMDRPPVDNPWQLPGEAVVGPDGRIRLVWRYNSCEDFPDARVLDYELRAIA